MTNRVEEMVEKAGNAITLSDLFAAAELVTRIDRTEHLGYPSLPYKAVNLGLLTEEEAESMGELLDKWDKLSPTIRFFSTLLFHRIMLNVLLDKDRV